MFRPPNVWDAYDWRVQRITSPRLYNFYAYFDSHFGKQKEHLLIFERDIRLKREIVNINKSLYILFKGISFNVRRVESRRRWSKERSVYRSPGKSQPFQPIRSLNAHKYFIESNWIAGEFLFARYNPSTVFSLFFIKSETTSTISKYKITSNPLIFQSAAGYCLRVVTASIIGFDYERY